MDDIVSGSLKVASKAEVGDNSGFDRSSLKAYVCESKLKRIIKENRNDVLEYVQSKFNISNPIKIRLDKSEELISDRTHEEYDVIDSITAKITSMNTKNSLKLWEIYEEKGLNSLLNAIQYLSPIQKI